MLDAHLGPGDVQYVCCVPVVRAERVVQEWLPPTFFILEQVGRREGDAVRRGGGRREGDVVRREEGE